MWYPPGRIFSVLPLLVLITLSLFVFLAKGNPFASPDVVARHSRQFTAKRSIKARQGGPGLGNGNGIVDAGPSFSSSSSSAVESPSESPSSSSSLSSVTSQETSRSSTTTSSSSSSVSSSSLSTTTFSSSSSVTPTTTSSSEFSSSSSSSSTFSTSSSFTSTSTTSSSTSRTSTSSSSSRTTLRISTSPTSTATSIVIATNVQTRSTSSISETSSVQTSAEATSTEATSSNGFLSNKGAMAGTFTTLGIVVVGGICAAVLFIRKKKRNEDLDIFDTEYKEYSTGNDLSGSSSGHADYFASDMTSLSANAGSHSGAHSADVNYNPVDYGFGLPPADRNSVASNHAGYGAFRAATDQRKPPMQSSGLRTEATWSADAAYAEPAVDENQSIHVVANNSSQYYASPVRAPGTAY